MGLNISIPISKNRQIKSAIEKAKLQTETARLEELNTRKELWKTVETLHQNVISAQSRYVAATNSVKSATISYNLVQEQFDAGMKNTVELLTEKTIIFLPYKNRFKQSSRRFFHSNCSTSTVINLSKSNVKY